MSDFNVTFLGASDAMLAMSLEILHAKFGESFKFHVVRNRKDAPSGTHPYNIREIPECSSFLADWQKSADDYLLIGVNLPDNKRIVVQDFDRLAGVRIEDYKTLVHPHAAVACTVSLNSGVIINPGVVIAPFSSLGELVTLNRSVSIGHHSEIGSFSTVHPGVNIAGHCRIGSGVTIGMGSNVIDGVAVGDNTIVGSGSLVTKDLPDNVVAYGSPAKVIRQREQPQ